MVLWQIPLGNTKMRAMNNTWGHYQDNHVEWWFDDATGTHLATTVAAGVVAMLFGGGADGTTAAADAMGDGVTNPAAINGNNLTSTARTTTAATSVSGSTPTTPADRFRSGPGPRLRRRNLYGRSPPPASSTPATAQVWVARSARTRLGHSRCRAGAACRPTPRR